MSMSLSCSRFAVITLAVCLSTYCASVLTTNRLDDHIFYIFGFWGIIISLVPSLRGKISKPEAWMFLAFIVYVLSALPSFLLNVGGPEAVDRMARIFRFLGFIPLYFLMRRYSNSYTLYCAASVGIVALGLWSIGESHGLGRIFNKDFDPARVSGTTNAIQFGNFALLMLLVLWTAMPSNKKHSRLISGLQLALTGVAVYAVFSTGTRSALIAVPGLLAIYLVYARASLRGSGKWVLVATLLAVGSWWLQPTQSLTPSRYNDFAHDAVDLMGGRDATSIGVVARLEMWKSAWLIFKGSPLVGTGLETYEREVIRLKAEKQIPSNSFVYPHPHSEYMSVLYSRGLVGMMGLLSILLVPFLLSFQAVKEPEATRPELRVTGLLGLLFIAAYMHFLMSECTFDHRIGANTYVLLLAAIMAQMQRYHSLQWSGVTRPQ